MGGHKKKLTNSIDANELHELLQHGNNDGSICVGTSHPREEIPDPALDVVSKAGHVGGPKILDQADFNYFLMSAYEKI